METVAAVTGPEPRPRNEPAWCVKQDHEGGIRRHVSRRVSVGDRLCDGQVSAWLIQADGGPQRLLVNVAHAVSASVETSLEDAAAFRDKLSALLEQAGWPRRG